MNPVSFNLYLFTNKGVCGDNTRAKIVQYLLVSHKIVLRIDYKEISLPTNNRKYKNLRPWLELIQLLFEE